jgi:hypothetical protein
MYVQTLEGLGQDRDPVTSIHPLPSSLEPEFIQAVHRFRRMLLRQTQYSYGIPRRPIIRLLCYLGKLLQPVVDDRFLMRWRICWPEAVVPPRRRYLSQTLTGRTAASEAYLDKRTKTEKDVDRPEFISRLKSLLLSLYRLSPPGKDDHDILKGLESYDNLNKGTTLWLDDMQRGLVLAPALLDPPGITPVAVPRVFRVIRAWVNARRKDPKSIYSSLRHLRPPRRPFSELFWRRVDEKLNSTVSRVGVPTFAVRPYPRCRARGDSTGGDGLLNRALDETGMSSEMKGAIRAAVRAAAQTPIRWI